MIKSFSLLPAGELAECQSIYRTAHELGLMNGGQLICNQTSLISTQRFPVDTYLRGKNNLKNKERRAKHQGGDDMKVTLGHQLCHHSVTLTLLFSIFHVQLSVYLSVFIFTHCNLSSVTNRCPTPFLFCLHIPK